MFTHARCVDDGVLVKHAKLTATSRKCRQTPVLLFFTCVTNTEHRRGE